MRPVLGHRPMHNARKEYMGARSLSRLRAHFGINRLVYPLQSHSIAYTQTEEKYK